MALRSNEWCRKSDGARILRARISSVIETLEQLRRTLPEARRKEAEIDEQLRAAYGAPGVAEEMLAEALPLMACQVWPPDDDLVEDHCPEMEARKPARSE
jgi:hypothetical protein